MILVFPILQSIAGHLFSTKSHKNGLQQQSKNEDSNKKLLYHNIRAMLINKTEREVCAHACN